MFPKLAKDKDNIVKLTYREHYICHWLLTKIYPSKEMTIAFWLFHSLNKHKGYFNSHAYENNREDWCKLNGDTHHLFGALNGMFGRRLEKNPTYGRKLSKEQRQILCEAQRRSYSDPFRHVIQSEAAKKAHLKLKLTSPRYHPLKCTETNEIFFSVREASSKLHVNRSLLTKAINNGLSFNGLHYQYMTKDELNEEAQRV